MELRLTEKEVHTLKAFENKVVRKVFGHKRAEVRDEWRKLHNYYLDTLYFSIVRMNSKGRCDGRDMWHVLERRFAKTLWLENMNGKSTSHTFTKAYVGR
jgi:hypothetical protein